tara:strand:+ start:10461 stop:11573 length:1113 start_codon:yes stop_codon:yes gene_type:complete
MNISEITPNEIFSRLDLAYSKLWPIWFHGASGVGKSAIILAWAKHQAAKQDLDFYHVGKDQAPANPENTFALIDLRVSTLDALDIKGAPKIEGENTVFKIPSMLPDAKRHGKFGAIFLDELPQGSPSVTNGLSQIIHDRILGDHYKLPDGWLIIAAGNRKQDQASTNKVGAHIYNRFMHFEVCPDVKAWAEFAIANGSDGRIPAFIRSIRDDVTGLPYLHLYVKNAIAFPSPRVWSKVDELVSASIPLQTDMLLSCISSLVGEALANKVIGFLELANQLATWNEISKTPATARLPEQGSKDAASIYYVLIGMCVNRADEKTISSAVEFISRFPDRELQSTFMLDLQIKKPELMVNSSVSKWRSENSDIAV